MDLGGLKAIAVPLWVKALVGAILLMSLAADLFIVYMAVASRDETPVEWFSAGVTLFGSLIPIILLALLLALSASGAETLQRKTSHILLRVFPSLIKYS